MIYDDEKEKNPENLTSPSPSPSPKSPEDKRKKTDKDAKNDDKKEDSKKKEDPKKKDSKISHRQQLYLEKNKERIKHHNRQEKSMKKQGIYNNDH